MKIVKNTALFAIGGGAYVGLELLWRRRSHGSMFAAGGISFLLLGKLRETKLPRVLKPFAGAAAITGVELAAGLLVNRDHHVWDYRELPGNYRGQICPAFTLLWIPVSAAAMALYPLAARHLEQRIPGN